MNQPMPLVDLPIITSGQSNIDELGRTLTAAHKAAAAMTATSASNRFAYAEAMELHAATLEHYATALAAFAADVDPTLANSNKLNPGLSFSADIDRAMLKPATSIAAHAANLANAAVFAMYASALSSFALRAHTPDDRVFALQATKKANDVISRHHLLFNA